MTNLQKGSWQGMKKFEEICLSCRLFLRLLFSLLSKTIVFFTKMIKSISQKANVKRL